MPLSKRTKTTVDLADVPKTSDDMTELFTWKHGNDVHGVQAKNHPGMKGYIRDINRDYGTQGTKKDVYINTLESVGKQLKDIKK